MEIEQNIWGFTPEGEAAVVYTMRNATGAEVRLTNLGAALIGVTVPGRGGRMDDVALGYGTFGGYMHDPAAPGKVLGRCADPLDPAYDGLQSRIWNARVETDRVVFAYTSPDGEAGRAGELGVEVVYDWSDGCDLEVTYFARGNADMPVNLACNPWFNLAGEAAGTNGGHDTGLPEGCTPVGGHAAGGDPGTRLREMLAVCHPGSGRSLEVRSSQQCICLKKIPEGRKPSKSGPPYAAGGGLAIACCDRPDTPRVLPAGETYHEKTVYSFRNEP